MGKLYKDSKVELTGFTAAHYDFIMNLMSLGRYDHFIKKAVVLMQIQPEDKIIDLGCGTGRNAYLMTSYLSEKGGLLGMDISDEMEKAVKLIASCKGKLIITGVGKSGLVGGKMEMVLECPIL